MTEASDRIEVKMVVKIQQVVCIKVKIPGGEFCVLMQYREKAVHFHAGCQFFIKMIKSTQVKSVYLVEGLPDHSHIKTDLLLGRKTDCTKKANSDEHTAGGEELFHAAKDKKIGLYRYDLCLPEA